MPSMRFPPPFRSPSIVTALSMGPMLALVSLPLIAMPTAAIHDACDPAAYTRDLTWVTPSPSAYGQVGDLVFGAPGPSSVTLRAEWRCKLIDTSASDSWSFKLVAPDELAASTLSGTCSDAYWYIPGNPNPHGVYYADDIYASDGSYVECLYGAQVSWWGDSRAGKTWLIKASSSLSVSWPDATDTYTFHGMLHNHGNAPWFYEEYQDVNVCYQTVPLGLGCS